MTGGLTIDPFGCLSAFPTALTAEGGALLGRAAKPCTTRRQRNHPELTAAVRRPGAEPVPEENDRTTRRNSRQTTETRW
jgi:hypothetical protein